MSKKRTIAIDGEIADQITVLNLMEYRSYLKKEIRDFKKGSYLHPEDVGNNIKVIEALNLVIKQYGKE